jgi:hypothetical protein
VYTTQKERLTSSPSSCTRVNISRGTEPGMAWHVFITPTARGGRGGGRGCFALDENCMSSSTIYVDSMHNLFLPAPGPWGSPRHTILHYSVGGAYTVQAARINPYQPCVNIILRTLYSIVLWLFQVQASSKLCFYFVRALFYNSIVLH